MLKSIDFDSLKSLQEDGIDMSFIDSLQKQYNESNIKQEEETSTDNLELLSANAQLIDQLKNIQSERLSGTPPMHLSQLAKPDAKEIELAKDIQNNLVNMVGQIKPNQIVQETAIRAVMGIKAPLAAAVAASKESQDQITPMDVQ